MTVANSKVRRRLEEGAALADRLKSAGRHYDAEIVASLVRSLRASNATNSLLHRDLQTARRAEPNAQENPCPTPE